MNIFGTRSERSAASRRDHGVVSVSSTTNSTFACSFGFVR